MGMIEVMTYRKHRIYYNEDVSMFEADYATKTGKTLSEIKKIIDKEYDGSFTPVKQFIVFDPHRYSIHPSYTICGIRADGTFVINGYTDVENLPRAYEQWGKYCILTHKNSDILDKIKTIRKERDEFLKKSELLEMELHEQFEYVWLSEYKPIPIHDTEQ